MTLDEFASNETLLCPGCGKRSMSHEWEMDITQGFAQVKCPRCRRWVELSEGR